MLRVGLTGGLATGKSFIGRTLASLGCHLISADELGHQALLLDGDAYHPVVNEFGGGILREDGSIDRRRLAAIVFEEPAQLARLNALVHPAIFRRQEELIEEYAAADPTGIVVVEAAIMIEAGSHTRYRKLIVAVCSEEQQIQRAMRRDNLTREQVEARIRRQMPLADKRRLADYVIDTSGPKEDTVRQTESVHRSLRSIAQ
jgi:dephospho-CoA kinase